MKRPAKSPLKLLPTRKRWLNTQVASGRFADLSEALNFCVRQAARIESTREEFDRAIAEGDKGPFERVDDAWWARLRAETAATRAARSRRRSA